MENNFSRRRFVKGIAMMSVIAGLNPLEILKTYSIPPNSTVLKIIEDVNKEYQKFLRQTANSNKLFGVDEIYAKVQYSGLVKLLAISYDPKFDSLSPEKKIKKLKGVKAFEDDKKITAKDRQNIYKELISSAEITFDASAFAYVGTSAIVGTTISVLNLVNPAYAVVLTVPRWMKIANAVMGGAFSFRRGYKEFEDRVRMSSASNSELLKTTVYDKYLSGTAFTFENDIKGFTFIASDQRLSSEVLEINSIDDEDYKEVLNWIKGKIGDGSLLSSQENFGIFLEQYVEKIGSVQEKLINDILDARESRNEIALAHQRDKTALFGSIQNFIGGTILSNMSDPKQAEVLNTLIGVGFQLAMGASFGPMGIAAVGISLATTIFSKGNENGFEKALFKALQQIQEQLSVINKKLDIITNNQIQIVMQLNQILEKLDKLEDIVIDEFDAIRLKQNLIYNNINTIERQHLKSNFVDLNDKLRDSVMYGTSDKIFEYLQDMRTIATTRLNTVDMTKFRTGNLSGIQLKQEVYFNNEIKYNIPLYDSIGLLSGLSTFNSLNDSGSNTVAIVHPIEFFSVGSAIIDWLVVVDLPDAQTKGLIKNLVDSATYSQKAINHFADKAAIQQKATGYLSLSHSYLFDIHTFLQERTNSDFGQQTNLLNAFTLTALSVDISTYFNQEVNTPVELFYQNTSDMKVFNLMSNMKIIRQITTLSHVNYQGQFRVKNGLRNNDIGNTESYLPSMRTGAIVGSKSNVLEINGLLNFEKSISISVKIPYTRFIKIRTYIHKRVDERACGHDGQYDCYNLDRVVTGTYTETLVEPSWRSVVETAVINQGYKIEEIMPGFSAISFENFLSILVGNWFRIKKTEYYKSIKQHFSDRQYSKFDGQGTSLMVLSKLNQVIKSSLPESSAIDAEDKIANLGYEINYGDEIYIKEDIERLIDTIASIDFEREGKIIYQEIIRLYNGLNDEGNKADSPFFYKISGTEYSAKLNPALFPDLVTIMINQKIKMTAKVSVERCKDIVASDCEPFLREFMLKAQWFQSLT